jgi:hypothetical protein
MKKYSAINMAANKLLYYIINSFIIIMEYSKKIQIFFAQITLLFLLSVNSLLIIDAQQSSPSPLENLKPISILLPNGQINYTGLNDSLSEALNGCKILSTILFNASAANQCQDKLYNFSQTWCIPPHYDKVAVCNHKLIDDFLKGSGHYPNNTK